MDTFEPQNENSIAGVSIPSMEYAPAQYAVQLASKVQAVGALLAGLGATQPEVFSSPPDAFRMRAEFRLWHDRSGERPRCFYAMFDRAAPRDPVEITQFPIACEAITRRMWQLLDAINSSTLLSHKLFQVEFLGSRNDDLIVSMIYHRQLDEAWREKATELETTLECAIIGRARKQRLVLSREHVTETLDVAGRQFHYEQLENSFTQPNAAINEAMVNWACAQISARGAETSQRDLLELYCGNGNFTLPLASRFRKALGTEISKTGIASARRNAAANAVHNAAFVRMSSAETACALRGEREFRRLADIELDSYDIGTVLVDPPRAGLDAETLSLVATFDRIVYISCNPHTLVENLRSLGESHRIVASAVFDQFPYTPHCEAAVILERHSPAL